MISIFCSNKLKNIMTSTSFNPNESQILSNPLGDCNAHIFTCNRRNHLILFLKEKCSESK